MNGLLKASLLALPLLAVPTQAHAWGGCGSGCGAPCGSGCNLGPVTIDFGFHWHYRLGCGGCGQAGPWYLYWPYLAHFSTPAPVGGCYPNWPGAGGPRGAVAFPGGAMTLPGAPVAPPGTSLPPVPPASPGAIQPTSYSPTVPAYWYGR